MSWAFNSLSIICWSPTSCEYVDPKDNKDYIANDDYMYGTIFILRKDIGVGGWSRKWQFPLLYVVKMSLCRWVGGSKKTQNTLT
mgnify:CR=1 FL=1